DTRLTRMVLDQLAQRKDQGIALAMISHNHAQIAQVADDIIVMRHGEIVESGPTEQLQSNLQHDYTKQLLAAIPSGDARFAPLSQDATTEAGTFENFRHPADTR